MESAVSTARLQLEPISKLAVHLRKKRKEVSSGVKCFFEVGSNLNGLINAAAALSVEMLISDLL
jgi:hypothetical protein